MHTREKNATKTKQRNKITEQNLTEEKDDLTCVVKLKNNPPGPNPLWRCLKL